MPHLPVYGTRLTVVSPWVVQQPHHQLVLVKSVQYKQVNIMTWSLILHELHNKRTQSVIAVSGYWTELIPCNKDFLQKFLSQSRNSPNFVTDWLIPSSRVLLEKLTGLQLVKKFHAFYGARRFITSFISARHLSLSWASSIQSILPHPTS